MKNKENGITLISLIITIIVMLILVGVTINVTLNGGLFSKAKIASEGTQKQVSKEQLISAMIGAYNDSGNFVVNDVILPEGATWCTEEDTDYETALEAQTAERNWVITNDNNKFYIDSSGTVLDSKPQETEYSFTLNSLGTPVDVGDSAAIFNKSTFWEIVGKDLSVDEKFSFILGESICFIANANNSTFKDFTKAGIGLETMPNSGYGFMINEFDTGIMVSFMEFDDNNFELTFSNYEAFLNDYGDVVFAFQDVSGIEIPEGD